MKRKIVLGLLVAAVLAAAPAVPQAGKSEVAKMTLKVGDTAPDFTLLSDQWKAVKLSDFRGKKNVLDRKSTRLNSSHRCISYAVFCLKKKKRTTDRGTTGETQGESTATAKDRRRT